MFVSESRRFRSAEFLQLRREPFWLKVIRARTSTSLNIRALSRVLRRSIRTDRVRAKCIVLVAARGRIGDLAIVSHVGKR